MPRYWAFEGLFKGIVWVDLTNCHPLVDMAAAISVLVPVRMITPSLQRMRIGGSSTHLFWLTYIENTH